MSPQKKLILLTRGSVANELYGANFFIKDANTPRDQIHRETSTEVDFIEVSWEDDEVPSVPDEIEDETID